MRVRTGRVVGGKIVIEGEPLAEGAVVTVVGPDDERTFELGPQEVAELLAAMDQVRRGDLVDAHELLRELGEDD